MGYRHTAWTTRRTASLVQELGCLDSTWHQLLGVALANPETCHWLNTFFWCKSISTAWSPSKLLNLSWALMYKLTAVVCYRLQLFMLDVLIKMNWPNQFDQHRVDQTSPINTNLVKLDSHCVHQRDLITLYNFLLLVVVLVCQQVLVLIVSFRWQRWPVTVN